MSEPGPNDGAVGCEWPIDPACFTDEWGDYDTSTRDRAVNLATNTLRRLTGYRVGGCPITVRPCRASCCDGFVPFQGYYNYTGYAAPFYPHQNAHGLWVNNPCCGSSPDCSCSVVSEVILPGPVGAVYDVRVDGVIINSGNYRLDGNRLVWVGTGVSPWPVCQDVTKADTATDTFSVTYLNSYPVDSLGQNAAGVLALEYARACVGGACRLPPGVTSITRQGINMTIEAGAFPGGFTGIREVDAYIALWNPNALRQEVRVWSPDLRAPRHTTL